MPLSSVKTASLERVLTVSDLRAALAPQRGERRVALVPTMGNLHEGHLRLVREARKAAEFVVVSLFVNPLQFSQGEDFDCYPRTLDQDAQALESAGADLLFAPSVKEMYPAGKCSTRIQVGDIGEVLCGRHREGHFNGMATVVSMLFNQVQPDVAVFGEKDYQQLQVIRQMVTNLHVPIEIRGVATVREPDGLAMSSRNQYLSEGERQAAPLLHQCLQAAAARLQDGDRNYENIQADMIEKLRAKGFDPDYFEIREADLARPTAESADLVVLAAARLGKARLIDNLKIVPKL